ncbi:hypothetical protein HYH02_006310 [Chlamydomonas schloesseri]|uniref:Allene oxide cyclase barrel-like domain-containing protein n=1 Tax=Chlamydomonas schloesseri TaxID=2026947 RepID=A0A836B5Z6_9CHLO|nr:hypothetical protein HYH02_006310 [Chlamydomonas schloesseri]|eukprot:KAG2448418.1 hypothetical protein HYH02_006310 [Chlamydomonas schloesseri]
MAFSTRRVGVLAVMALAMIAMVSAKPPKEACGRTIVVTELYNEDTLAAPEFLMTETNQTKFVGYTLGYEDEAVWGGSGDSGRKAGDIVAACFVNSVSGDDGWMLNYCTTTLTFGDYGAISWMGQFPDKQDNEFYNPIVGGTGIFEGARGTVRTNILSQGERWRYQFKLLSTPKC